MHLSKIIRSGSCEYIVGPGTALISGLGYLCGSKPAGVLHTEFQDSWAYVETITPKKSQERPGMVAHAISPSGTWETEAFERHLWV